MPKEATEVERFLERQGFVGLPEEKTDMKRFMWLSPGWVEPSEDDSTKTSAETSETQGTS